VPYTNNVSERHLRPSVIFRKVTNGFRCEWGAEMFCASCLPQTFPSSYRSDRSEQLHSVNRCCLARYASL
jgi:hypothetical protein